jgi:OCT family organic cation transporter-like MFS transporter 4/5
MICELDYQATILTSMIYVGSLVGFFVIPHLADNYGRKIMIHISWGICVIGTLLIASAPSPILVGFGFFFSGFGANPAITLNYSFINEQVVGKWRQRYGIIIQVTLGIG